MASNTTNVIRLYVDSGARTQGVSGNLDQTQIFLLYLPIFNSVVPSGNLDQTQIFYCILQRTAARWTCRRWRNTSSVGDMLDDLEWPSLETRREQSSLTFFYKIHSGTVDLDKDKYLTPAPNLRRTRASHESQYTRYFAYSDALKNSFFPRTIPMWNSLPSSVVSSKTIEEFKAQI